MELINEDRKRVIYIGIVILALIFIISAIFIKLGLNKEDVSVVPYNDTKNLEYKVILKENDYYKNEYVEKGNQYIASLIDHINADFKYTFDLQNDYEYNYKIVGTVDVTDDKTNKSIYTFSEDILNEKNGQCKGKVDIAENIDVDFNKYNDLIKQFVSAYDLKNVTCKLSLNLEFGVKGISENFVSKNANVMSLDVPLATNTIAIDTSFDLTDVNNFIEIRNKNGNSKICLVLGIALITLDIMSACVFFVYVKHSKSDEDKYNEELRKIINNYDSYISRLDNDFDMKGYQILKVQKFGDLLEIRDTMQLPIIMLENKEQLVTCFAIPTNNKILYFYSISVKQFALDSGRRREMRKMHEEKV